MKKRKLEPVTIRYDYKEVHWPCPLCKAKFVGEKYLIEHIERDHRREVKS